MKSYIAYKNEIEDISSIKETMSLIEKVSASHIHSLRKTSDALTLYSQTTEIILNNLSKFYFHKNTTLSQKRKFGKNILIIVGGEKSLVGDLWQKLSKESCSYVNKYDEFIVIGKKIYELLTKKNDKIKHKINKKFSFSTDIPTEEEVTNIVNHALKTFNNKNIKKIDILYADFKSLSKQNISLKSFLPFSFQKNKEDKNPIGFPFFTSSKKDIYSLFIEKYISSYFHSIILKSKLSEFSARTISMEHAKEKSKNMVKAIKINYKKEQRKLITRKQLEIAAFIQGE